MNAFLSIVIPMYNVAPFVDELLCSIAVAVGRLQTRHAVEVVCVDDGSTDGTGKLLDQWTVIQHQKECVYRLRILHQGNAGVSAARNSGLAAATGTWIWFVDGDDLIHADALRIFVDFAVHHPDAEYLMFGYSHDSAFLGCRQDSCFKAFVPDDAVSAAEVFREVCRVLFRRDLMGGLRFLNYSIGEDVAFSISYREQHRNGYITPVFLYYYRIRSGSATEEKSRFVSKTVDWIRSNRIIFEKMAAIIGGGKLVWWYPATLWQGFNGCPHALPFKDVRPFYREYVDLLYSVNRDCPYSRNRRLAIQILHHCPSPVLGWLLIYGQERLIQAWVKWRKGDTRL